MFPVIIQIGPFTLASYGVLVAGGYLLAILWLKNHSASMPAMTEEKFWTLVYGLFFGAVMGGKLLYLAVEWRAVVSGQLRVFADFRYGFVFFGGVLGSMLMGLLLVRRLQIPYLATADYLGVALPLGHALGRLGCLAAGCCYGRPTTLPWGVPLGGHPLSSTPPDLWGIPLHPTPVYESLANAGIAFFLARRVLPLVEKGEEPAGTVIAGYWLLYCLARFGVEWFRGDDRGGALLGLHVSQWIALLGAAAALGVMSRLKPRLRPLLGL